MAKPDNPPLRLEWRSPAELAENPKNWRRHPQTQLAALTDVIGEVGWAGACLYNERTSRLIDGHARRKVALDQGTALIPVLVGDWSEADEAKILATLDPLAAMAEADASALDTLLRDVQTSSAAVNEMLEGLAKANPQALPEAGGGGDEFDSTPDDGPTRTALGDVWVIGGKHRLLVGDCTEAANVERLMDGKTPNMMVTDPPYGVDYGDLVRGRVNQKKDGWQDIENDALDDTQLESLLTAALGATGATVAFVWHPAGAKRWCFWRALETNGWKISQEIIWVKNALVFGRADYQWRHEPCMYCKREGSPRQEDRTQTTVWEIDKIQNANHPTQKPLECMSRPIRNHSAPGDIVYDPFLGSGTTLIAAHRLGRICYGCEIEPRYADVILKRAEAEGLAVAKE